MVDFQTTSWDTYVMIILKWWLRTAVLWRETHAGLMWLHVNRVYVRESGNRKTRGTARWVARSSQSCTMHQHVNYKPELLYVPVTCTAVWGPLVSSTRLVRKMPQFIVSSFYVVPTAHTCVCLCRWAHVRNTWNKYDPHHIQRVVVQTWHSLAHYYVMGNGVPQPQLLSYFSIHQLYRLRQLKTIYSCVSPCINV